MPRLANGVAALSLFGALVATGAIATSPLYLLRWSAGTRAADQPQVAAAHLQAAIVRLDRMAEQIERIQQAQQSQDQEITSLRAQQERASDRIAAVTRQILDLAQHISSQGPVTRQELEEFKQAVALSRQQLNALRGAAFGGSHRTAQRQ